jgi:hypothetical protein
VSVQVEIVGTNPINNRKQSLEIGSRGFAQVAIREGDPPPPGEVSRLRFYAQYLGSSGAEATATNGSNADMSVNGGTTAQEFYIESHQDYDIRIMTIAMVLADSAIAHNNFGNVSALGTGFDLKIEEAGEVTFLINKATTGGRLIAQAGFDRAYGDGALSFELSNWNTNEDAQTVAINVGELVPGGLRIGRGTEDRIVAVVNDDLTGLTEFYCRVLGYRHYP